MCIAKPLINKFNFQLENYKTEQHFVRGLRGFIYRELVSISGRERGTYEITADYRFIYAVTIKAGFYFLRSHGICNFLCLCPLSFAAMLDFNIPKVAYSGLHIQTCEGKNMASD